MAQKKPGKKPEVYSGDTALEPVLAVVKTTRGEISNPIRSEKELVNLLNNIDDIDYLKNKFLKFDGTVIKLKLEGDSFESSLPGSLILGLARYQEKIYRIYLKNKYGVSTKRRITPEEAKQLEIKVIIRQGSTEAWIEFAFNFLKEALNKMPADQVVPAVLGLAGIVAVSAVLIGVGSKTVKETFKTKRALIAQKREQSKDEVEKKRLEFLETSLNTAMESMRMVSLGIIQSGPDRVLINDKIVSTNTIASVAEALELKAQEATEDQSVVTGTYRIQRVTLDFKKDSASADIFNIDTGDPINGLILQPKSISDGSYRVLKQAQDQQDIKLQIIITMRGDRIYKAVLDKIL